MEDEGSLLEIVQRKELELKAKCDSVSQEMEILLESAKKKAESLIQDAARQGKEEASRIIEEETASLDRDLDKIRSEGRLNREMVKNRAEMMMPKAVDFIVEAATVSS
jgi:vacuolar-type H+-ATPase subunit H